MYKTHTTRTDPAEDIIHRERTPQQMVGQYLSNTPFRVRELCTIQGYTVDFYIHSLKLVIEIQQSNQMFTDTLQAEQVKRNTLFHALGLTVVRFLDVEIVSSFEQICARLNPYLVMHQNHSEG